MDKIVSDVQECFGNQLPYSITVNALLYPQKTNRNNLEYIFYFTIAPFYKKMKTNSISTGETYFLMTFFFLCGS